MKKLIVLLLTIILALTFVGCGKQKAKDEGSKKASAKEETAKVETVEFKKPEKYASVILITINPEFRLYLDEKDNVLAVEPVNEDAKNVTKDMSFEGKDFKSAMEDIVTASNEKGFIKENANVNVEIVETKVEAVKKQELLDIATTVVNNKAAEIKIEITVNVEDKTVEKEPTTSEVTSQPVHTHSFSAATCTAPAKCTCGTTNGKALGHSYSNGKCSRCGAKDPNFVSYTSVKTKNGKWEFRYVQAENLYLCALRLNLNPPTMSAVPAMDIEVMYAGESPEFIEERKKDEGVIVYNGKYYWGAAGSAGVPMTSVIESGNTVTATDTNGGKLVLTRTGENTLKVTSATADFGECTGKVPVGTVLTFTAN